LNLRAEIMRGISEAKTAGREPLASPRLALPEQAAAFTKEVEEEPKDGQI
jgi:hypothetical protein